MSEVYVVTMSELGYCVVGVFNADSVSVETLQKTFPDPQYVIHGPYSVEKDTYDYE